MKVFMEATPPSCSLVPYGFVVVVVVFLWVLRTCFVVVVVVS